MKILREGTIPLKLITFTCRNCGCIFEADKTEYTGITNHMEELESNGSGYKCICPTCSNVVYDNE